VVVNDEAILVIGRNAFAQLLQSSGGGGMGCGVELNQPTRGMLHDDEHIEDSERGGHCDAEITSDNESRVIFKKDGHR
jgi:hypothetical protein